MTGTTLPLELDRLVDTHLRGLRRSPTPRAPPGMVRQVWRPDGHLIDPAFDGRGHREIAAMTDAVLAHCRATPSTGRRPSRRAPRRGRYRWALVRPDGVPAVTGTDVSTSARDGRIARVLGFFGTGPRTGVTGQERCSGAASGPLLRLCSGPAAGGTSSTSPHGQRLGPAPQLRGETGRRGRAPARAGRRRAPRVPLRGHQHPPARRLRPRLPSARSMTRRSAHCVRRSSGCSTPTILFWVVIDRQWNVVLANSAALTHTGLPPVLRPLNVTACASTRGLAPHREPPGLVHLLLRQLPTDQPPRATLHPGPRGGGALSPPVSATGPRPTDRRRRRATAARTHPPRGRGEELSMFTTLTMFGTHGTSPWRTGRRCSSSLPTAAPARCSGARGGHRVRGASTPAARGGRFVTRTPDHPSDERTWRTWDLMRCRDRRPTLGRRRPMLATGVVLVCQLASPSARRLPAPRRRPPRAGRRLHRGASGIGSP